MTIYSGNKVDFKHEYLCILLLLKHRRVYQGLQKLLDVSNKSKSHESASRNQSSKKARDIGKLVESVALGKEIDLNGKLMLKNMYGG